MTSLTISAVLFAAGLVGAAAKAWCSTDQATVSRKSIGDVLLGGLTGLLVPLFAPAFLPAGANLLQQAALIALAAYTSADVIQNVLQKIGVTLPAAPKG